MSTRYDDDLTTDACPSPPRDETGEGIPPRDTEFVNNPKKSTHQMPKATGFSKIQTNTSPTAFASVINISNANGIHIGSNYNVYMKSPNESQKKQKTVLMTEAIKELFSNPSLVTKSHILTVAPHINEEWRDTARNLGYTDGQISQFHQDYFTTAGIKEVIYQFLLDWIQNEPETATIGKMSKTLWITNQSDAVQVLVECFKEKM